MGWRAGVSIDSEFHRPEFTFEKEYGQFRNWWARDRRLVGNPFSILMYLVSHSRDYTITQQQAKRDLGLGKTAFLAARRTLEEAGFLLAEHTRYPAGTVDAENRPIGGHQRIIYRLLDPENPTPQPKADNQPRLSDELEPMDNRSVGAENREITGWYSDSQPKADNRPRVSGFDPDPVDNSEAKAENPPPGFRPFKEDQETEGNSSSSDGEWWGDAAAAPPEEDHDDVLGVDSDLGVGDRLRQRWPFFDHSALLAALDAAGVVTGGLRPIEEIAAEVLIGRAVSPRAVTTYVSTAIVSEPWRWARQPEAPPAAGAPRASRWDCSRDGHDWGPTVWAEIDRCVCTRCDEVRRNVDPAFAELEAEIKGFARSAAPAGKLLEHHLEEVR